MSPDSRRVSTCIWRLCPVVGSLHEFARRLACQRERLIDGLPLSLPIQVFKQDAPKDEAKYVSAVWANTVAAGTLMSGLVCPFFGAILDMYGWRKAAVMTTSIAMCVCLSIFAQIRCCPDRARRLLASRPCRLCGHQPATRVRATACGHLPWHFPVHVHPVLAPSSRPQQRVGTHVECWRHPDAFMRPALVFSNTAATTHWRICM